MLTPPAVTTCRRCSRPFVAPSSSGAWSSCPHCGASIHPLRLRDNRLCAILSLLALIVLTVAILLPFMSMTQLGVTHTYSLVGGIRELFARGYRFLGTILLVFSVAFPYAKLLALLVATSAIINLRPRTRLWLHRIALVTGRYSLLDILVVAIIIVVVRFDAIAEAGARSGTILFAVAVFMSIAAGLCFDDRLLERSAHE